MTKMNAKMRRCLLYILTVVVITIFWVGLEYIMDGQIIGQDSDTVICLVLSWFIVDKINYFMTVYYDDKLRLK